jgi:quercetin dioxygenase-like cupin family protein
LLSLVERIGAMRAEADGPVSLAVVESKIRRGEMPPLHAHEEEEAFYVLEGTLTVHTDDRSVRLEAGEAFVAPRDHAHTHEAQSDRVRYLTMTFARSLGRYEDFLRAVAVPRAYSSPDEAASVAGLAAANGITVLGPPGTLPGS